MKHAIKLYSHTFSPEELKGRLQEELGAKQGIELAIKKTEAGSRDLQPEVLTALIAAGGGVLTALITAWVMMYKVQEESRQKELDRIEQRKDREATLATQPTLIVETKRYGKQTLTRAATPEQTERFIQKIGQLPHEEVVWMGEG